MGEIRLGKIHLRWCDECNVPILEQPACSRCSGQTREVKVTPPGDARPAFDHDIAHIKRLIDLQFGEGSGSRAIPDGHIVLLNKAPDIDRMDEVVVDGHVVGASRFSLLGDEKFLVRPAGAAALAPVLKKGWVVVDPGAIDSIRNQGASTLAVGVIDCSQEIVPGSEVVVIDPERRAVSVGVAKMSASDMMSHKRGTAVKSRWTVDGEARSERRGASWHEVLEANREVIGRRTSEAVNFVRRVATEARLPVAVSYSGGKDSLATLLLVLDAGMRPKLLFVDTGLEFQQTTRNVEEVAREHSLELITESAGDAFWKNLDYFGPPAKDYRWCCKTCKLGPATRLIQRHFPDGVLSFIGQRAYESEKRAQKGKVWRNPWTPNQLAASPIQKWTALHVWLYLFSKRARANPLYEKGLERIGCFMCPASDLAELRRVRDLCGEYPRWQQYLRSYADAHGKPDSWLAYDLWRWKRPQKSVIEELGRAGIDTGQGTERGTEAEALTFRSTSGYSPCVEGLSMEGVFSKPLDMRRVANLLNMMGEVSCSPDGAIAEVSKMTVFAEGPVMVKAKTEEELLQKADQLREIVFRAMSCAGCGICVGRCRTGALRLNGRVEIDASMCTHCGDCFGPCPVIRFKEDELDI